MENEKAKKQTCASLAPCNTKNAEKHNFRLVQLKGIRRDLTYLNEYEMIIPISEREKEIKREYKKAVGQTLQPHSNPIVEVVIYGMKTRKQMVQYKETIENELRVQVLHWALHHDEGHPDRVTKQWIPNDHGHFAIDLTIWTHEPITAPKKRHGHLVKDQDGKVVMETKDRYARRRHLTKRDLARLQDIAAEVTGLERGVPSSQKHIQSQRFKAMKLQEDIDWLTQRQKETQAAIDGLNRQREGIEEENVKAEKALKNAHVQLRSIAKILISTLDSDVTKMNEVMAPEMAQKLRLQRDGLNELVSIEPEPEKAPKVGLVSALAILIAGVIRTLMELFESAIQKLKKQLSDLHKQIQSQSLRQSAKSALTSLLDKPANEQMRQLAAENQALREANAALEAQNSELGTVNETNQQELLVLRSEVSANKDLDNRYRGLLREKNATVEAKNILASDLIARIQPQEIIRLEYLGFPTLLGAKRWDIIKTKVNLKHAPKVPGGPKIGGLKK